MDNILGKNEEKKDIGPIYRFLLLCVLLFGLMFILYGLIQSNFGYPPLEDNSGQAYQSVPTGSNPIPSTTGANTNHLQSNWGMPLEVTKPSTDVSDLERLIWQKTNEERKQRGLPALNWEDGLSLTARYHSNDMATKNFFDHQNLENVGPSFRAAKIHRSFVGLVGENIFMMTQSSTDIAQQAEQIMRGWMNSTGHRENILRDTFNSLGVGCVEVKKGNTTWIYATQVFGQKIGKLDKDLPGEIQGTQTLSFQVKEVDAEFLPPTAVFLENITNRGLKFQVPINATAIVSLSAPGQEGLYQLVFYFPFQKNTNTQGIFPGPMISVKKVK